MIYFAYGSNLCTGRLTERVPSAKKIGKAKLAGYELRFHKKSKKDGSAKADAYRTGDQKDVVWGVIFEIDDSEKAKLDDAEGLGIGYDKKVVTVVNDFGVKEDVHAYFANPHSIDSSLRPYSWYLRFVLEGAKQHELPSDYIEKFIRSVQVAEDPDKGRGARKSAIKCESPRALDTKKIGDIAEALTGFPFDSNLFDDTKGFPLIRIRDLKNGGTHTFYKGTYDKEFIVKKGDFLIGMDGEFNLVEWKGEDALLNQRVCKLTITDRTVSPKYLYYFLPKKLKEIEDATPFVTVKHLSHKKVLDINVPLPPLPIQKQIAAILEKADAARQKRRQANQLTEQFLQSAFLEMFGDPVTNPKGWEKKRFNELCDIRRGASPRPIDKFMGGTIPWIKIGDGSDYSSLYIERTGSFVSNEGATKSVFVPAGSLIFANCGVSLGFARILKIDGCIHDGWLALSNLRAEVNGVYLLSAINMLTDYFRRIAPGGTQPNLNTTILGNTVIPVPPIKRQEEFKEIIEKVESLRAKQRESERELENLFNSLMLRAFRGELVR